MFHQTQDKIKALHERMRMQEKEEMRLELLENLLQAELTQNAAVIDTEYVDALTREIEICHSRVDRPVQEKAKSRRCARVKRFGTAIAALLILGVACASFLLKEACPIKLARIIECLMPLARRFGIRVNTNITEDVVVVKSVSIDESVTDSEWDTPEEYVYDDIADVKNKKGQCYKESIKAV